MLFANSYAFQIVYSMFETFLSVDRIHAIDKNKETGTSLNDAKILLFFIQNLNKYHISHKHYG